MQTAPLVGITMSSRNNHVLPCPTGFPVPGHVRAYCNPNDAVKQQTAGMISCSPLQGRRIAGESDNSSELAVVSGLVDRGLREVNLSDSSSDTTPDNLGKGALLVSVNLLSLVVLPAPIP